MTLCTIDPQARNMHISAKRQTRAKKPTIIWKPLQRGSSERWSYSETTALREQLGFSMHNSTLDDRGIYRLSKPESWLIPLSELQLPANITNTTALPGSSSSQVTAQPFGMTFNILGYLPTYEWQWVGEVTSADFMLCTASCLYPGPLPERNYRDRQRCSRFQAMLRVLASTGYHESVLYFNETAPAQMQLFMELDKPVSKTFLAVVGSLLFIQIIFVAIVTGIFAFSRDDLIIGGA
ncbi:hypothetical protein QBC38DRAFT_461862 [Podospora fimiseda]|uniref:Uncharacterized protein n=1 Tax=Podospora fimiseda TaxID=252190 RepID=A0AAN6YM59_9PEZI|nr:hypothetical protein QBC38DRAFT_461862 [Podospora fimiseda]